MNFVKTSGKPRATTWAFPKQKLYFEISRLERLFAIREKHISQNRNFCNFGIFPINYLCNLFIYSDSYLYALNDNNFSIK